MAIVTRKYFQNEVGEDCELSITFDDKVERFGVVLTRNCIVSPSKFEFTLIESEYLREALREAHANILTGPHPSHQLRWSDASTFDQVCIYCGVTDATPLRLSRPCRSPHAQAAQPQQDNHA